MGNAIFCGCIGQASVGVVEKWGRFYRLASPGIHFFNPFVGECLAGVLSTRIFSLDVKIETKTKSSGNNSQGSVSMSQSVPGMSQGNVSGAQMVPSGIGQNMMNGLGSSNVSSGTGTMIPTPGMQSFTNTISAA